MPAKDQERSMRVLLDERPCDVPTDTVMDAISAAAGIAENSGRLIVEVMIDGRCMSNSEFDEVAASVATAKEIRLTTANPIELVSQTLADAADALADADALQQSAAKLLQSSQPVPAMEKLGEALSIWNSVQQALNMGCQLSSIDLSDFQRLCGIDALQRIEQLNTKLKSVQAALSAGDTVALSDILLYELPDAVLQWRELLTAICQHLNSAKEPG
jgi:hypothetical protein